MRADLRDGSGPMSALLRLRRGTRMEGDAVVEADRAGDVASRAAIGQVLDQRVQARNEQLRADPAQYVIGADPTVREAAARAAANPSDQSAMAEYVARTQMAQRRLGVPEAGMRVLSKGQAEQIVADLQRADPGDGTPDAPDGPALRLAGLRRTYGTAWPQVYGDLVRDGKLGPEYQVLANIQSPIGQADFSRMLAAGRQAGGMDRLAGALSTERRREIDREVETAVAPFWPTVTASGQSGGRNLGMVVQDQVRNLAVYYALGGEDAAAAVRRATNRILNDKYEFQRNDAGA